MNQYYNREHYADPTPYQAIKQADPRRQLQGKQSRAAGRQFETLLINTCEYYRQAGIANISKTPEPTRQLSSMNGGGQFQACYEKKAQVDFKGTVAGGKSIVLEAKHTDSTTISRSRLLETQARDLETHHKLGAAAFILVSYQCQRFYRIPWVTWRDMEKLFNRKSLTLELMEPYQIRFDGNIVDFLPELKGVANERR